MRELEKILKTTEEIVNMHYEDDSAKAIILRNMRDIRKYMNNEEDILKFYYCESEDDYYLGQRVQNMYYAKYKPGGFTWFMSRYLPWGTDGYPSKPKEIPFVEWIEGFIRKHMNDGWIPAEKRLPEDDIEVLITYSDVDNENETGIDITTYGYATLGGNKLGYKEWRNPFPYFKGNYKVIAWRPLPERYHPEPETEKPDWRQDMLRKFDRRE